jgi:hypothetical protein
MTTRRAFLQYATLGVGAVVAAPNLRALAAPPRPLVETVATACRRLAPLGWRQLLLDATNGELDLGAIDLTRELGKPLAHIDRGYPGLGDFDAAATRAIEPGHPDRSLLYHAFASPGVVADRGGKDLRGFPTLAEIEAVENYVYGAEPPTLTDLRTIAAGRPLGMVVFALQYRNTPMSVQGRHAELCFARSGIARLGNREPLYDARARNFIAVDDARPFDFRVVPRRFAAYLAVQMKGASERYGPQDALAGDKDRQFWVPVHKLFSGRECIAGLDLQVTFARGLRNDELAMFRHFLDQDGLQNNWSGEDLEQYPFVIKDALIGSMSQRPEFGASVLEPRPQPLTIPASYKGKPLTFPVDGSYTSDPYNVQLSSMQVLPSGSKTLEPRYMLDAEQLTQRPGPEYVNIRHRVLANGRIDDLNLRPDLAAIMQRGGYQTLQYIDGAGDGWIEAQCPQLAGAVDAVMPAYCMVALPDFFPKVTQRQLMLWWRDEVPKPVRDALWAIEPLALSQTRIAANITLPVAFSLEDTTITAIVSQPTDSAGPVQPPNGPWTIEKVGLPDGSPGMFDPGWDTSQAISYRDDRDPHGEYADRDRPVQKFLAGYGLGSPFVEDAKLCAAFGAFWPGVAPDGTRTFQPDKQVDGTRYPYPTIVPLTDEEIGSAPVPGGTFMPWDGVRGPHATVFEGRPVAAYTDARRVDYIDLAGTMTAALTSRIDTEEYQARILAMESIYWALGIHDPDFVKKYGEKDAVYKVLQAKAEWAVLSFRVVSPADADLAAAERAAGAPLGGSRRYFFDVYRWGEEILDPADMRTVFIEMRARVSAYTDGGTVLLRHDDGPWATDKSMPTSLS